MTGVSFLKLRITFFLFNYSLNMKENCKDVNSEGFLRACLLLKAGLSPMLGQGPLKVSFVFHVPETIGKLYFTLVGNKTEFSHVLVLAT